MSEFDNLCVVDDCDKDKSIGSHYCARHKNKLPEGATETLLNFDQPGFIYITITPPGVAQNINLEEVVGKLKCDAYNQGTFRAWEKEFAHLSNVCRMKRERFAVEERHAEIEAALAEFTPLSSVPSSDEVV